MKNTEKNLDTIKALCTNRGFVYPGSEIYGGLANTWDYGPLGAALKNNIKNAWLKKFVQENKYNVGLDSAILMNPQTWIASGHLGGFSDPLMDCKECKTRHRADNLIEDFDGTNVAGWSNEQLKEYIDEKNKLETLRTERGKSVNGLSELVKERDTVFIYSSSKIRPKKAIILTLLCYILFCLIVFLGYKYFTRNPYSRAEDLSKYETKQTEDSKNNTNYIPGGYKNNANDFVNDYINFEKYQEALKREEQRKINYDNWEKNYKPSNGNLVVTLCVATGIYALIIFILFMGGRYLNAEITKIQAIVDEQTDQITNLNKSMDELKERINNGYNLLCELHHIDE